MIKIEMHIEQKGCIIFGFMLEQFNLERPFDSYFNDYGSLVIVPKDTVLCNGRTQNYYMKDSILKGFNLLEEVNVTFVTKNEAVNGKAYLRYVASRYSWYLEFRTYSPLTLIYPV